MKKITLLTTALIALNLVGCSTVQNQKKESIKKESTETVKDMNRLYKKGEFYKLNGKLYNIYTNKLLTGRIQNFKYEDELASYKMENYVDGELVGYKTVEDSKLELKTKIKNGLADGKIVFKSHSEETILNIENGLAQGFYSRKNIKTHDYSKYDIVNGLYHGKAEIKDYKDERIVYYNEGEVVEGPDQVKKVDKLNIEGTIEFKELQKKDSKYYTKDGKLFNGIAQEKRISKYGKEETGKTCYYITDGELKKEISLRLLDESSFPKFYFIEKITEYKDDKIIETSYRMWEKSEERIISKKTNKVLKLTGFSNGKRKNK